MLEIKNLCGGYPDKKVLHEVTFSAHAGETTAIIGPNGCGKSTLLKSIVGILSPASGQILFQGQDLLTLPSKQMAKKIAYLSQTKQIPDISVKRLILHGRFPYLSYPRRYKQEDYDAVQDVMEALNLSNLADHPLSQLSGGQQQKVYIAMALVQDTDIILLDEPTTFLDLSHQLQMIKQVQALANLGKTVLLVIHQIPLALEKVDHLVLIKNGLVVSEGSPEDIYQSGALDAVFDIQIKRALIDNQWRYFCS